MNPTLEREREREREMNEFFSRWVLLMGGSFRFFQWLYWWRAARSARFGIAQCGWKSLPVDETINQVPLWNMHSSSFPLHTTSSFLYHLVGSGMNVLVDRRRMVDVTLQQRVLAVAVGLAQRIERDAAVDDHQFARSRPDLVDAQRFFEFHHLWYLQSRPQVYRIHSSIEESFRSQDPLSNRNSTWSRGSAHISQARERVISLKKTFWTKFRRRLMAWPYSRAVSRAFGARELPPIIQSGLADW